MQGIDIIDESFDRDRTSVYELSIQVSLNGFSYAVKDTIRNTFIALYTEEWENHTLGDVDFRKFIGSLTEAKPWIKEEFKKVLVAFDSHLFTIVPNSLFEPEKAKEIFNLAHPFPEYCEIRFIDITENYAKLIYIAPTEFINEWHKLQPKSVYTHSLQSFIKVGPIYSSKKLVQVDISDKEITIICHKNNALVLANTYACSTTTDVVYYVNSAIKAVFDDITDDLHINITGSGKLLNGLTEELHKYFKNVTHQADYYKPVFFTYRILRHRVDYFKLFNLGTTCE